jgi:hypothetical protein
MPASKLQLNIRLYPDLDRAIEEYRKSHDRIPNRTDAVKDLLRFALRARGFPVADETPAPTD